MSAQVIKFAKQRIEAISARPDGWGSPEAVELQLILLVETVKTAFGVAKDEVDTVNERYNAYLAAKFPEINGSLAHYMGLKFRSNGEFMDTVMAFVKAELRSHWTTQPGIPPLNQPADGPTGSPANTEG